MTEGKIKVIIKRPDEKYGHVTNISQSLKNLQRTVGGYIEMVTLAHLNDNKNLVVICDEEGRIKGKDWNCQVCGIGFVGDIIVAETDGEELTDLEISFNIWKNLVDQIEKW